VFRLVQESLTNCLKHAGASAVARVRLRYAADGVDVEITDNGPGRTQSADSSGRGLDGMRERAAVYAGTVEAGPRADGAGGCTRASRSSRQRASRDDEHPARR